MPPKLIPKAEVINATDNAGKTPLDNAIYKNKSELKWDIIKLMKDHGALQRKELKRRGIFRYHETNTCRYLLDVIV